MKYNERQDIWLFENDLSEYQQSDEGRAVWALLTYTNNDFIVPKYKTSKVQLKKTIEAYWDARNDTGLHYSDKEKRKSGQEADKLYAQLYSEQN